MDICQTSSQGADEKCVLEGVVEGKLCSSSVGENMFKGLKGICVQGVEGECVQGVEGECVQGVEGECVQVVEGKICSKG